MRKINHVIAVLILASGTNAEEKKMAKVTPPPSRSFAREGDLVIMPQPRWKWVQVPQPPDYVCQVVSSAQDLKKYLESLGWNKASADFPAIRWEYNFAVVGRSSPPAGPAYTRATDKAIQITLGPIDNVPPGGLWVAEIQRIGNGEQSCVLSKQSPIQYAPGSMEFRGYTPGDKTIIIVRS